MTAKVKGTAPLRRLAVLTLLSIHGEGLTLRQLSDAIGHPHAWLHIDMAALTEAEPSLYEGDCPESCDLLACTHSTYALLDPDAMGVALEDLARAAGIGTDRARRAKAP